MNKLNKKIELAVNISILLVVILGCEGYADADSGQRERRSDEVMGGKTSSR
jgi:hypothetical protein